MDVIHDGRRGYARVDLGAGKMAAFADVGHWHNIAAGVARLWAVADGDAVVRLETVTGAVLGRVPLPFRPLGLWVGRAAVWV